MRKAHELLGDKSHLEQIIAQAQAELMQIEEELEVLSQYAPEEEEAQQRPVMTFTEMIEDQLGVQVFPFMKHKKVPSEYGYMNLVQVETELRHYYHRVNGAIVDVVFHPETGELKKMSCDKRKNNKEYKQWANRDFSFIKELWEEQ